MSNARPLNSYAGGRKKIAMPAEGEISPVEMLTNPQAQYQQVEQQQPVEQEESIAFNQVPEELPEYEEEESAEQEYDEQEEVEQEERPAVQRQSKSQSENFKELRLARERAEKKAAEQEALIAHLLAMQAQQAKSVKPVQQEPEDDLLTDISDDAFIEGKDYKRLAKVLKRQSEEVRQKTREYEQRIADMAAESRVRAKCPDLDSVVTEENIYLLRERHPEVAAALNAAPDGWDKYSSVYTMIKTLGIHKQKEYNHDKMKVLSNHKKPKTSAILAPQQGESPLSGVNAFVNDYKMSKEASKNAWKEMQEAMRKS